jgi:hypothetical protein
MKLNKPLKSYPRKIFNRHFYRFTFSFVAVVAGVLALILLIGVGVET